MNDELTVEKITQLLAELHEQAEERAEAGTFTTGEIASAIGKGEQATRRLLRILVDQKLIEPYSTVRPNVHGVRKHTHGYRLVQPTD